MPKAQSRGIALVSRDRRSDHGAKATKGRKMPGATSDEFELDIRLQDAGSPSAAHPTVTPWHTGSCAFGCTD